MRILDSKYVEHQPTQNTWTYDNGGNIVWKLQVPEGYSIHAGIFLKVEIDLQVLLDTDTGGGANFWKNAYSVNQNAAVKGVEAAGLPFQQSINPIQANVFWGFNKVI